MKWTLDDTIECYKQGWAPFTVDSGQVAIMKLDDPDGVAEEFGFAPFKGKRYKRDDTALASVKRKAKKGDVLAQRALKLVAESKND